MNEKIAMLATGDEIVNGDTLNTNGQFIAQELFNHGLSMGRHLVCSDNQHDIETAIRFLLADHAALIITGGLGATSDDRTRYALAAALNTELFFDEQSWKIIGERFQRANLNLTPSNRQQALFPVGAMVIPNPNGSAPGCMIIQQEKFIAMLPGPPYECSPMFLKMVLPAITAKFSKNTHHFKKWRLFGVAEGEIGEQLDGLVKPYQCQTGYRLEMPYLEFKLYIPAEQNIKLICEEIEKVIAPYVIATPEKTASEALIAYLTQTAQTIIIHDTVTGGLLEATLKTPKTIQHIKFVQKNTAAPHEFYFALSGCEEYWQGKPYGGTTTLCVETQHQGQTETIKKEIVFRQHRLMKYCVELISHLILQAVDKR